MTEIRIYHSQLGMAVEARQNGEDWQTVQLTPYKDRTRPNWSGESHYISPFEDEREYFAELDKRGTSYRKVVTDSCQS